MIVDDTPEERVPDHHEDDDVKALEGFQFDRGLNGALARLVLRLRTSEIEREQNPGAQALAAALGDCDRLNPTIEVVKEVMAMQEKLAAQELAAQERLVEPLAQVWAAQADVAQSGATPTSLNALLCELVGSDEQHFLKYDVERKVVDYAANINHLSCVVDLTRFMALPGSGFQWVAYFATSPAGKRVRAAKKALITATDDIQLLGGGGMAHDSAIAAFDAAKKEFAEAEAALLKYAPGTVPYEGLA